jgi:hypothetical protein
VSSKLAIVFCVHHKPWLMMSTLLTFVSQARQDADLFFVYNIGDGEVSRESYREYREVAARAGVNPQLSPFDERVREVCRLRGWTTYEVSYENDHGLDSGCWYKFIRDGRWRDYDHVLFIHEGMLLAHPGLLQALIAFSEKRPAHFIASGHEKRRVPRAQVGPLPAGHPAATPMDVFHRRMVDETFDIFCRDPEFKRVYDRWDPAITVTTEHHVPGVGESSVLERRLRARVQKEWGSPYLRPAAPLAGRLSRQAIALFDAGRDVSSRGGAGMVRLRDQPPAVARLPRALQRAAAPLPDVRGAGPAVFGLSARGDLGLSSGVARVRQVVRQRLPPGAEAFSDLSARGLPARNGGLHQSVPSRPARRRLAG